MAALGVAACWTPDIGTYTAALTDIDFGISTTHNGQYFTADPFGVLQIDSTNGNARSWDAAVTFCANIGKRMPSIASFKALYDVVGATPPGFASGRYWSNTAHPYSTSLAYGIYLNTGTPSGADSKADERYVRCGS